MRRSSLSQIPPGAENPLNHAIARRDADTIAMVEAAVDHQQTLLAFQSVVIASDMTRVGFYEGLIRVLDETGRVIPAKDFIPAIERTELGREVDRIALRMGLQCLYDNPALRLSINMSARSIGYQPWMNTLNTWLKKDGTIGERLILEITESSAMDQPEVTRDFMDRLSRKNICFALDDFGAGYTALRYLRDFYFDIMKIDGSYCRGIAEDRDSQALVRAMISMARHFDMLVVAECVERMEDVKFLTEAGVDCLQGFFFDAPTTRPQWAYADQHETRKVG